MFTDIIFKVHHISYGDNTNTKPANWVSRPLYCDGATMLNLATPFTWIVIIRRGYCVECCDSVNLDCQHQW